MIDINGLHPEQWVCGGIDEAESPRRWVGEKLGQQRLSLNFLRLPQVSPQASSACMRRGRLPC